MGNYRVSFFRAGLPFVMTQSNEPFELDVLIMDPVNSLQNSRGHVDLVFQRLFEDFFGRIFIWEDAPHSWECRIGFSKPFCVGRIFIFIWDLF